MERTEFSQLGNIQKIFLLIASIALAIALLFVRTGFSFDKPLEQLARNSLQPEIALSNGRPTIIEFYADRCEVCQQMAPSLLDVKINYEGKINLVLLNIDNQKWQDLIEKYDVNGIPQLNIFDENGLLKGQLIGFKSEEQIQQIANSLSNKLTLPEFKGINNTDNHLLFSPLLSDEISLRKITPRSHF